MYKYILAKRYHRLVNFAHVVIGILLADGWKFTSEFYTELLFIMVVFGFLLYGSLYAINNAVDQLEDSKDIHKSSRVVASGKISRRFLIVESVVELCIGGMLLILIRPHLLSIYISFIVLNLAYTLFLKPLHHVYASMIMSLSIPLRTILGISLVGGNIYAYWPWYILVWSGVLGYVLRKIQFERQIYAKKTIQVLRVCVMFVTIVVATHLTLRQNHLYILLFYGLYYIGGQIAYASIPQIRQLFIYSWRS